MEAFFVVAFREGLESFLVLGIVLAFLQKQSLGHIKKYAWGGFAIGILLSLASGIIFSVVVDDFSSEELQYSISLGVLLIAIVLLTYMIFWMQHNSEAAKLRNKIELSTNQKLITFLIVLAAIFREGLETVLFSLALTMGAEVSFVQAFLGLSFGFSISGLIVWLLFKSSIKLPLKSLFKFSTILLVFSVAGLVSLFVKGMQGIELLPTLISPIFDLSSFIPNDSFFGRILQVFVGYDAKPSLLQILSWSGYLGLLYLVFRMRRRHCLV